MIQKQRYQQQQQQRQQQEKKECLFCKQNINEVDFKDLQILRRFINPRAKIVSGKRTGTCTKHQRMISEAIKRARIIALLPFVTR